MEIKSSIGAADVIDTNVSLAVLAFTPVPANIGLVFLRQVGLLLTDPIIFCTGNHFAYFFWSSDFLDLETFPNATAPVISADGIFLSVFCLAELPDLFRWPEFHGVPLPDSVPASFFPVVCLFLLLSWSECPQILFPRPRNGYLHSVLPIHWLFSFRMPHNIFTATSSHSQLHLPLQILMTTEDIWHWPGHMARLRPQRMPPRWIPYSWFYSSPFPIALIHPITITTIIALFIYCFCYIPKNFTPKRVKYSQLKYFSQPPLYPPIHGLHTKKNKWYLIRIPSKTCANHR